MVSERRALQILSAIAAVLAGLCVLIAVAFHQAHQENLCWRAFIDEDEFPPTGDCRKP